MGTWNNASDEDKILLNALSILYSRNEKLLHFLLNPDRPRLLHSPEKIKYNSGVLSDGEQILINIGLDIWDGSGGIHFCDLYQSLDVENFQNVLMALLYLRRAPKLKMPILF